MTDTVEKLYFDICNLILCHLEIQLEKVLNKIPKTHLCDYFRAKHNERLPMSEAGGLCEVSLHNLYDPKSLHCDILVIDQC
jgi:hypothetical protein